MNVNKKQIGWIAGLACVIVLIVLLLTMCNGSGNGGHQSEPVQSEPSVETTAPVVEETTEATEETTEPTEETTEATEETTEATESTTSGNTTPGGTGGYVPDYGTDDDDDSTGSTTETAPAAGSEGSPYVEQISQLPDAFSSVTVPVDAPVFHHVYGAEGGVLTIEDSEAYVIYNEVKYEPDENGILQVPFVEVKAEEQPSSGTEDQAEGETETAPDGETDTQPAADPKPFIFQLGSRSAGEKSFVLLFDFPLGSFENPEQVSAADGLISIEAVLEAGDADGYYYAYTAANNGTLTLQASNADGIPFDMIVTLGDQILKLSEAEDGFLTVNMLEEDQVLIQVVTIPGEDGTYPAAKIDIQGQVEDAPGSKGNPLMLELVWNEAQTEATASVTIEPGTKMYYNIYGANSMILSIQDADAYVIAGEDTWKPDDTGVVSGEITAPSPREPALIAIGNDGEDVKEYAITFTFKPGTRMNPVALEIDKTNTAVIGENAADGCWYTWTAEEEGTLTLTMPEGNWKYVVNNVTAGAYGDEQWSDSDPVENPAEIEVAAGDVLNIMVSTYDPAEPWSIPAGEIAFDVSFNSTLGTKENPIWLVDMETVVKVKSGTPVYCYEVKSDVIMTVTGQGDFTVTYNGANYPAENGVVTIDNVSGSRQAPIPMILTNYGAEAAEYTVTFTYPLGHRENPQILTEMGAYTASVKKNSYGYFYEWQAEADGEFTVSLDGNDWFYVINNLTASSFGDSHYSKDQDPSTETIQVKENDKIQINVSTSSGDAKDVAVEFDFYDPTFATEENPEPLWGMKTVITGRAGSQVWCDVMFGNVNMTITADGAFTVNFDGKEYTSQNGKVYVEGVNASRQSPKSLVITNSGETKLEYTILFENPLGSSMNPEEIKELREYTCFVKADSQDGMSEGYWYTWTAPGDGVFALSMKSNDWTYSINNITTGVTEDVQSSSDGLAEYTLNVKAGDVLKISIGTASQKSNSVTTEFDYYDPNYGSEETPITLTQTETVVTVRPDMPIYCDLRAQDAIVTVTGDGVFTLTVDSKSYAVVDGAAIATGVTSTPFKPARLVLTSDSKTDCTITISYPEGHMDNPHVLEELGNYTVAVKGDGQGYWFTWTAETAGDFTVTMLGKNWNYTVTKVLASGGYQYGSAQDYYQDGSVSQTVSVEPGDQLEITVGTADWEDGEIALNVAFQEAAVLLTSAEPAVFEGTYIPKQFELDMAEIKEMGTVDLTQSYTLWASKAGIYHLDSKQGPLLVLDFTDDTFVNLAELVASMELTVEVTDADGNVTVQRCNELLESYIECAWVEELDEDVTRTLYPLTEDLELILKSLGEQLGWFDPDSDGYLFGAVEEPEEGFEPDSLWMFACSYVEFLLEEETTETVSEAAEATETSEPTEATEIPA